MAYCFRQAKTLFTMTHEALMSSSTSKY